MRPFEITKLIFKTVFLRFVLEKSERKNIVILVNQMKNTNNNFLKHIHDKSDLRIDNFNQVSTKYMYTHN